MLPLTLEVKASLFHTSWEEVPHLHHCGSENEASHGPKLTVNNPVNCGSYPLSMPAPGSAWQACTLPPQQTQELLLPP